MHLDGFIARIIFEEQETAVINIPILTLCHKAHPGGVAGEIPWWHAGFIIHTSGDDRAVRIAVDKINDHFIADAGIYTPPKPWPAQALDTLY